MKNRELRQIWEATTGTSAFEVVLQGDYYPTKLTTFARRLATNTDLLKNRSTAVWPMHKGLKKAQIRRALGSHKTGGTW